MLEFCQLQLWELIRFNKNIKIIVDKPVDLKEMSREEKKDVHNIVNKIIKNNFEEYNLKQG